MIISANDLNIFDLILKFEAARDPFACRIVSLYNSYNPNLDFVDYWLVLKDNQCSGAISRNGSEFVIFLSDAGCCEEVSSFLKIAGASAVVCSKDYRLFSGDCESASGRILVSSRKLESADENREYFVPKIKDAYKLLDKCADDNFRPPLFEDFYVDVNHRLRHKTMRMYGIKAHGKLVSVAMTVAETQKSAVLGAVACSPEHRNCGYGSNIVKYISNELIKERKTVFVYRAENANISFYNNLGFKDYGKWNEYYLRET